MYTSSKHLLMYTKLWMTIQDMLYCHRQFVYVSKETVIIAVDKFVDTIYMYNIVIDNFVNGNKQML